jgi:hypothetical protein
MESVKIKSIRKISNSSKRYDITVAGNSNYFANGILIHNCNARFCYRDGRLWVGSRNNIKAEYVSSDGVERNLWWKVAKDLDLESKFLRLLDKDNPQIPHLGLSEVALEGTVVYGEVYGNVQDLKYGVTSGAQFKVFDTFNPTLGRYNDWDITVHIAIAMGLEIVPELFRGAYRPELEELRNGPSMLYPGHTREGYVIKPAQEKFISYNPGDRHAFTGRLILKNVGEDYKTRKRK